MNILIRDIMQEIENIPNELKSSALADVHEFTEYITAFLPDGSDGFDCVGIGNTDATEITIEFFTNDTSYESVVSIDDLPPIQNGLYLLEKPLRLINFTDELTFDGETALIDGVPWIVEVNESFSDYKMKITHNGSYFGRIAIGKFRKLGTAIAKEIGFYSTEEISETLSGQVIPGAGGYFGRTLDLDVRYKIEKEVYNDIYKAFKYISKGYPYFIELSDEAHKMPDTLKRFHASTNQPISKLQSSTYAFKYSYKFSFIEKF